MIYNVNNKLLFKKYVLVFIYNLDSQVNIKILNLHKIICFSKAQTQPQAAISTKREERKNLLGYKKIFHYVGT